MTLYRTLAKPVKDVPDRAPDEKTSDFRDGSESVCVEDPDVAVAGFHHALVAETAESLVDRLTADPEQHPDRLLREVDIWLTVGLLQEEIGHLSQNRLVHETNHMSLGLFHLAHPGHQPPHEDARMDRELGKQARPLESQTPNRPHRPSGGGVWGIAEHGYVAEHRARPAMSHDSTARTGVPVDLHLTLLDEKSLDSRLPLGEEVVPGSYREALRNPPDRLDVGPAQGLVSGTPERTGKPVEVLLVGLAHISCNRRAADILPH